MQGYLVSPARSINGGFAINKKTNLLLWACYTRKGSRSNPSPAIKAEQDHYAVLGLSDDASPADVKSAYRSLALKYHPDVSKDLQAGNVFKSIRLAYEVLSNETSRAEYDAKLKFHEHSNMLGAENLKYNSEFYRSRTYREKKSRQKKWYEKQKWQYVGTEGNYSFSYSETELYEETSNSKRGSFYEETAKNERGSFLEVVRFTFLTLLGVQTIGSRLSLLLCSLVAALDPQLDAGYKLGYLIAWILGGRAGILLTLCLSFTSWLCGKASSSFVALVVMAMWVGTTLSRFVPLPQGAILILLYMSIKLQDDYN